MPDQASDASREHLYEERHELSPLAGTSVAARPDDPERRLDTLIVAVGEELAREFFWKADTGTVQTYEHRLSYRYVHIDRVTGTFFDQQRTPLSLEQALAHAMPRLQRLPAHWTLAPMIVEPDLAPFVRSISGDANDREVPAFAAHRDLVRDTADGALSGFVSRSYRGLQARLRAAGRFARGAATPMGDAADAAHGHLQGSDLSVASFTRRAA